MKKILTLTFIFLILIMAYRFTPCYAYSQEYHIAVTIPAIPGINVALDEQSSATGIQTEQKSEDIKGENKKQEPQTPSFLERLEQKIIETNQIVYLVTLIER